VAFKFIGIDGRINRQRNFNLHIILSFIRNQEEAFAAARQWKAFANARTTFGPLPLLPRPHELEWRNELFKAQQHQQANVDVVVVVVEGGVNRDKKAAATSIFWQQLDSPNFLCPEVFTATATAKSTIILWCRKSETSEEGASGGWTTTTTRKRSATFRF